MPSSSKRIYFHRPPKLRANDTLSLPYENHFGVCEISIDTEDPNVPGDWTTWDHIKHAGRQLVKQRLIVHRGKIYVRPGGKWIGEQESLWLTVRYFTDAAFGASGD
ncbi:MAG: hypothetical protein Q9190_000819 [Brigantiaea leucoxantha]